MSVIFDLKDKQIVITGGYGYLGKVMCLALAEAGAWVWCLGRSYEQFLAAFGTEHNTPRPIQFVSCDVAQPDQIKSALGKAAGAAENIDVLINNASSTQGQKPESLTDADLVYTFANNLGSTQHMIQAVIPYMQQGGSIINISSMYGLVSPDFRVYRNSSARYFNPPHYGAAKAGILQLTRYYANYLASIKIRVNALVPGAFPEPGIQQDSVFIADLEKRIPLERVGHPHELIGPLILLASDASTYITGQHIVIDGGWTIR